MLAPIFENLKFPIILCRDVLKRASTVLAIVGKNAIKSLPPEYFGGGDYYGM